MTVWNELDRFHLFGDGIDCFPQLGTGAAYAKQAMRGKVIEHNQHVGQYGEVCNWQWKG